MDGSVCQEERARATSHAERYHLRAANLAIRRIYNFTADRRSILKRDKRRSLSQTQRLLLFILCRTRRYRLRFTILLRTAVQVPDS